MSKARRLNIAAIEAALEAVQRDFPRINSRLSAPRDPLTHEVKENMLAGYRRVDEYLADGVDLFAMGNSGCLLELNRLVLCGRDEQHNNCSSNHLKATEEHFYEADGGGVEDLMHWMKLHRRDRVWKRAAGVFAHVLSEPQLYIEGNHRTGALLMSYLLAGEGRAPFVLTVDNAEHFFNPATLIKRTKKRGLDNLLRLPKLTKRFARLLESQANESYLLAC
jgi:hypothetical protein